MNSYLPPSHEMRAPVIDEHFNGLDLYRDRVIQRPEHYSRILKSALK